MRRPSKPHHIIAVAAVLNPISVMIILVRTFHVLAQSYMRDAIDWHERTIK